MSDRTHVSHSDDDPIDREAPKGTFVLLGGFFIVAVALWMNVYLQVLGRG